MRDYLWVIGYSLLSTVQYCIVQRVLLEYVREYGGEAATAKNCVSVPLAERSDSDSMIV